MAASTSSQAGATAATVTAPPTLKYITNYYDSCTFVKAKSDNTMYGCYTYRSCQSCLEMNGCAINDLGICISTTMGMFNLATNDYEKYLATYNASMDFTLATSQNLQLPAALTTNAAGLSAEQNWHFRAGEATYCSASDATCQECKQKNFWRGNDTSVLPDSRFCVGQNGCVCIQTCEVPTLKPQGCQWSLSPASSSNGYGYGGYGGYGYGGYYYNNSYTYPAERLAWWNWLLGFGLIVAINILLRCCSGESKRQLNLAKTEGRRAARREMGLPEDEPVLQTVDLVASVPSPRVEPPTTSDDAANDATKIETPRTETGSSEAVFVEVVDARQPASRPAASS